MKIYIKYFIYKYNNQLKLIFKLNYNIINIIHDDINIYEFEYLDDNNELQSRIFKEYEIRNIYDIINLYFFKIEIKSNY